MSYKFTREKNVQVLIGLLKKNKIRYVIASPGTTNSAFVGSIQKDSFFKIYSCVDERSAAYMACGISAEMNEPVAISCTGATASRNYASGLTEAYYRKLPILAITSTQILSKIGHLNPQVIDRSVIPKDVARHSVTLPVIENQSKVRECEVIVNTALLELKRHGGGPVHLNLETIYDNVFDVEKLPNVNFIDRITSNDKYPALKGRVAVLVGSHKTWKIDEMKALERFAIENDVPVFCDHTSGYNGKNRLLFSLAASQSMFKFSSFQPDILIHIGEISGDNTIISGQRSWRVSEDGEIRDLFGNTEYIFEMKEKVFFDYYSKNKKNNNDGYFEICSNLLKKVRTKFPELPLSNIWLASKLAKNIPNGSAIHLGILNSLRSWNLFELPSSVSSFSNVGGFGIDGSMSSLIGASLTNNKKLYFGVFGDLSFFYDINSLGNRYVGNNLRILLVNNGKGIEFDNYNHHAKTVFGEDVNIFISAEKHFGNKSSTLVKNYAENLGFQYISAKTKKECEDVFQKFLDPSTEGPSIIFEVFTNSKDESDALKTMLTIEKNPKGQATQLVKKFLGRSGTDKLKRLKKFIKK
jgi:2-succinyl-5-enolpyruvyl-6-hydroxy-3-cyclohexene-1-carboxylate synthase